MGKSKFVMEHEDSSNTDKVKTDSRHFVHKLFIHFNFTVKALKGGIEPSKREFLLFYQLSL